MGSSGPSLAGRATKINEAWHRAHLMPKNPSLDERVRWHVAHAEACGCRPIPDTVKREISRRHRDRT